MFEQDRQRIAEERAGLARPAPATLAPGHLAQALDALDDACSARYLDSTDKSWPLKPGDPPSAWRTLAGIRQDARCAAAVLFAAFAAEAFVNDFLAIHLQGGIDESRFAKIDRWPTLRKYIEGVSEAYAPLFIEGDEVVPPLRDLFAERNRLAHPRPGQGPLAPLMPDPSWREYHSPTRVAEWIIAVAGAAEAMERRCYGFDYQSMPATSIWQGRELVRTRAAAAEPVPPPLSRDQPELIAALHAQMQSTAETSAAVRLTVHELRDARLQLARREDPWDAYTELLLRPESRTSPSSRVGDVSMPEVARHPCDRVEGYVGRARVLQRVARSAWAMLRHRFGRGRCH